MKLQRGLTYKPEDVVLSGGVRVLRSSNIEKGVFHLRSDDVFVNPDCVNVAYVEKLDILITAANGSSQLVGKHAVINHVDSTMVHGGFMLLGKSKEPFFMNSLLSTIWYKRLIHRSVSGGNGAIGNLRPKDLETSSVLIPTLPEQQKIGSFFRQLDSLITLHQYRYF